MHIIKDDKGDIVQVTVQLHDEDKLGDTNIEKRYVDTEWEKGWQDELREQN